jgi:nitrous oxidase accessory protein NosD
MLRRTLYICSLWILAATGITVRTAEVSVCPDGAREEAGVCVLDSDLTLTRTLELASFTTLNCRGHRILPTHEGSGATAETYIPSQPAAALIITGDRGADVRNCIIGQNGARFDFGIVIVNSKNAGRAGHRIHDNEIHARDSGVTILRADDLRISDNVITWTKGFGIWFARDSDRNRINNNVLSSPGSSAATIRLVPDGPFRSPEDDGIFVAALHPVPLLNLVVGGRLYQFPNSEDGHYPSHEDNVIEGNYLTLPGSSVGKSHQGIEVATNAVRTRVIGNTIVQAGTGIRLAGLMPEQRVQRASRCTSPGGGPLARFCATDADCFIPGIDEAPIGVCPALLTDVRDLRARDTLAEENTLVGPFNSTTITRGAIFGGAGTVGGIIRGNQVFGTGIEPGIVMAGFTIETGHVVGNVVRGASFGLMLQQSTATVFGARVFLNDITGSTVRAIGVTGTFTLPTELSSEGIGNYWGHATLPCFRSSDTPLPWLIYDSHPSCVPVAASAGSR